MEIKLENESLELTINSFGAEPKKHHRQGNWYTVSGDAR